MNKFAFNTFSLIFELTVVALLVNTVWKLWVPK